jgi:putative YhbY family RNA-binding protein
MKELTPAGRKALRARAHALHPVVMIGNAGLTDAVLKEIDLALKSHELIKIRMLGDDREAREAALGRICAALDAGPVQLVGKILVVYRPKPEPEEAPRAAPAKKTGPRSKTRDPKPGTRTRPRRT